MTIRSFGLFVFRAAIFVYLFLFVFAWLKTSIG